MEENPYKAPAEAGATLTDYRRICGWCAWAMLATVVIINFVVPFLVRD
jgi:hypothetical protein